MKIVFTNNLTSKDTDNNVRKIAKETMYQNFGGLGDIKNVKVSNMPKTKNRFAHVFWSKPTLLDFKNARWNIGNQYEFTLALSALSLACLKTLGQEVVLYTDTKGYELLKDLGYDRIYNIFDNLNVSNDFWAAGKIMALQNEPLDSCIIDNDLFLYDGTLVNKIAENKVIASHKEKTSAYKELIEVGQQMFSHLEGANEFSSNTGFLKVEDFRLKQMFISAYFNCMKHLNKPELLKQLKEVGKGAYCADLLCEQFNYHKICKPKHLVSTPEDNTAVKGFTHLISFEKYVKMPLVLDLLKRDFSDYYNKVINKWNELDFSVEVEE